MSCSLREAATCALIGIGLMLGSSARARATSIQRQCVWNKGGYVLRVQWYLPTQMKLEAVEMNGIKYTPQSKKVKLYVGKNQIKMQGPDIQKKDHIFERDRATFDLKVSGDPQRTDQFPAGQGRCIENHGQKYTAILSVVDGQVAADVARIVSGALVDVLGTVGAVLICGTTAGTGCAAGAAAVTVIATGATQLIPDAKEIFYVGSPDTQKWLDAWGTVFNPVTGEGGDVPVLLTDSTGCHLWTDDFDGWCKREFFSNWGVRTKYGSDCPSGQGRAECAKGYEAGIKLSAGEEMTTCHLWTDDFDAWCEKEFGAGYGMKNRAQYGCLAGQGKAVCASGYKGGIVLSTGEKMTGCHLWTDNFDGWCEKEFGGGYGMKNRAQYGCLTGQGKAVCAAHR